MSVALKLSALAVRQLVDGAAARVGLSGAGDAAARFLLDRFTDHSQRLPAALRQASDRAWKTLEISLAGDSWWSKVATTLTVPAEDRAFRQTLRTFLDAYPHPELKDHAQYRQLALRQLREARAAGHLDDHFDLAQVAEHAAAFTRFAEPSRLLDAEWALLNGLADDLDQHGYRWLAWLLHQRPEQGLPLLVTAARYFFRRQVEADRELFQGLAFTRLEGLAEQQEHGFADLAAVLDQQGQRLEQLLAGVEEVVVESRGHLLDLKAEQQRHGHELGEMHALLHRLTEQYQLHRGELQARDSLSIRNEAERQLVKQLVARYRALPEEQQRQLPATLHALGKLQVVAGDFGAARRDFQTVATLVGDDGARAEAHFNAYRAALEERDWAGALPELLHAVRLDGARFAPFPLEKFRPQRVLGAGGFGVAFLCRHQYLGDQVVVKSLTLDPLAGDADQVFAEAQLLRQLDHPAIIRTIDCGYGDAAQKKHPFLVMDYFPGATLEEYVRANGPLPPDELLSLARPIAEGLAAAHNHHIWHRDVKPANLLVRQERGAWQVKIIDFGLALCQPALAADTSTGAARPTPTLSGRSIAGTLEYAAPEQLGRRSEPVGAYSDVYAFAKTCCYALLRTTQPVYRHWQSLPAELAELLSRCLDEDPGQRPQTFAEVVPCLQPRLSVVPVCEWVPVETEVRIPPPVPVTPMRARPRVAPASNPAAAERALFGPAVTFIGSGLGGAVLFVLTALFGFSQETGKATTPAETLGSICLALLLALACAFVAAGGYAMLRQRWYNLAMASCVAAMVGLCMCGFLGLPLGIWGMAILRREDVRLAFQQAGPSPFTAQPAEADAA